MKKSVNLLLALVVLLLLSSCSSIDAGSSVNSSSQVPESSAAIAPAAKNSEISQPDDVEPVASGARVRLTFDGGEAVIQLEDNEAARAFASQLPMTLTFEDFNGIEKICRLPDELPTGGVQAGVDPDVTDVALYAPWNALVFYYEDYGYNDSLIPMGHVESGMELLTAAGDEFTVTMELMDGEGKVMPQSSTTNITMTAGETVITAELDDSETTREFLATLPRTLTMNQYGGREYYGRIEAISEDGEHIADFENGDVTYYPAGPSFAVFFDGADISSQSNLIRMGKITSDLSVFQSLGDAVEMRIEVTDTATPSAEGGKTLVAYYSATGNTERVANVIAETVGGDIFALVPAQPYTDADLDWTDDNSRVSREYADESLRAMELAADTVENWDEYDTVYIGYPIWWGIAAWPVDAFIKANDFSGKTVIPFATSTSSGLGESGQLLADMAGTGEWLEGQRFRSSASDEDVAAWVNELDR